MRTDRGLILLIISLTIIVSSYVFYIRDKSVDYTPQGELTSDKKIVTDKNEILKYAEEYDLKDVDEIQSLQIYIYDFKIENEYQEPKKTFIDNIYGPEYYIKEGTVTEPVRMKGNLTNVLFFQQEDSSLVKFNNSGTCQVFYNFDEIIEESFFKDALGYSSFYEIKYSIDDEVMVEKGKLTEMRFFSIVERKSFEVWEADLFRDDKVGTFHSEKPVGIILIHYIH